VVVKYESERADLDGGGSWGKEGEEICKVDDGVILLPLMWRLTVEMMRKTPATTSAKETTMDRDEAMKAQTRR
jgi:hypothetical protein